MFSRLLFSIFMFGFGFSAWAQPEASNWYFGQAAGLTFNQNPPAGLTDGLIRVEEGSASISDHQGNLLCYSDGNNVYNKRHQLVENGSGLAGNTSSTQGVLLIPQPGNDSLIYVFTIGAVEELLENGFKYSILNSKANNGQGKIISKNNLLLDETYERISAVRHCNRQDVWIVVRRNNSDLYYAYLLTAAGMQPNPVISASGFVVNGDIRYNIGGMKFSGTGDRLATAFGYGLNKVELLQFNNRTGQFSNGIVFSAEHITQQVGFPGAYGIEFSPDGRFLYVNAYLDIFSSFIYQFDATVPVASAIIASRYIAHAETSGSGAGALQVGPDGKIYAAFRGKPSLTVIANPNAAGAACLVQPDFVSLDPSGQRRCSAGLPIFDQGYFDPTVINYDFTRTGNCSSLTQLFQINRITGIDSVRWQFGDNQTSTAFQPQHTFAAPGLYDIALTIYKQTCTSNQQVVRHRIWIAPDLSLLGTPVGICDPGETTLTSAYTDAALTWSTGSNSNSITIQTPGFYWVMAEKEDCRIADTIEVFQIQPPVVDILGNLEVCRTQPTVLEVNSPGNQLLWSTGETTASIRVSRPGRYRVTVSAAAGCTVTDSVDVVPGDCGLYMPSAFTPNRDGLNDLFGPIDLIRVSTYELMVYNRYGQEVFRSNDPEIKWDGQFKGKDLPTGMYLWTLRYQFIGKIPVSDKGTLLLIR
jgi:gliding motility-associated-like protein